MNLHELKSHPHLFAEICAGNKTHDLRKTDRDFSVGDLCLLREFSPVDRRYTGDEVVVEITYITDVDSPCAYSPAALHPDFCILSIALRSYDTYLMSVEASSEGEEGK